MMKTVLLAAWGLVILLHAASDLPLSRLSTRFLGVYLILIAVERLVPYDD